MKKTIILTLLSLTLAACGTNAEPSSSALNSQLIIGGSSIFLSHTGAVPNSHNVTVFAKTNSGWTYQADATIPVNSIFKMSTVYPHHPSLVRVVISPSSQMFPFYCLWSDNNTTITCMRDRILDPYTAYTIKVYERSSITENWAYVKPVSIGYFKTGSANYQP